MTEGTVDKPQASRRKIIERPRLTRLLDESPARIKLLVAPAGYGKTTLARQWLRGRPSSWYTSTTASTDVAALALGICGAIEALLPAAGRDLIERLPITPRPNDDADVLAAMLAADLAEWPAEALLVVDDYQTLIGAVPAEHFVETLLLTAPVNAVVLTRQAPTWASSRRILYGDIFELDREALAMTDDEAQLLLEARVTDACALVALAQGWPAVLALASMSRTPLPTLTTARHLHRFFADEVYRQIDLESREELCKLALYGLRGRRLALGLLPRELAEHVLAIGIDSGFLTEMPDGQLDMHPLLRIFLLHKLEEAVGDSLPEIVDAAVAQLISESVWDDAFELIERFRRGALMPALFAAALDPMLSSGRTVTLQQWLALAPVDDPSARTVSAELAFREGRFHESETLAALAARASGDQSELGARAYLVAGRAAHASSREHEAHEYYVKARSATTNAEQMRAAAYGQLAVEIELESPEARRLISELQRASTLEPNDEVLLASRLLNLETRFGLPLSIAKGRAARQLVRLVTDPVVRCSFRNVFGYSLASMYCLDECTEVTTEQLADAERCRLEFVVPYALVVQAMVHAGRHSFVRADEALDEADARAVKSGDQTASHISWAVRTRLYNAQGAFDLTLSKPLRLADEITRSLSAEIRSGYAIALAASGQITRARATADEALASSKCIEGAISSSCARAIASLREGDHRSAVNHAEQAFLRATRSHLIEPFVSAYRGCPELVLGLLGRPELHDALARVLTLADDFEALGSVKLSAPRHSVLALSPREKQVLSFMSQGLSNPEIARLLFISPVTVKVHVRHIFEKLGVKSRAEAALRATQLHR
jgi:LuxR family transcriptional regulator, maltose regulon positive regulatory protein